MPSEPIEYRALLDLQAALQAIDIAAGYHYTVVSAAVKLDPDNAVAALEHPGGARPFIVIEVDPDAWVFDQSNEIKLTMPLVIHWIHDSDPTNDAAKLQTYFRGCADVEKALAADIGRTGLATDTRITKRTMAAIGAQVEALIETTITLRRQYGQPNG